MIGSRNAVEENCDASRKLHARRPGSGCARLCLGIRGNTLDYMRKCALTDNSVAGLTPFVISIRKETLAPEEQKTFAYGRGARDA
eukprot:4432049-Pyramimonas_sp.AAC.1